MVVKAALACLLAAAPLVAQPFDPSTGSRSSRASSRDEALRAATRGVEEQQQEEKPKVPKDSLLVTVTGCLTGRVLKAADVRQEDTTSGPIIRSTAFRLTAKKDVMKTVKENDKSRVEVTGLIRKSSLMEPGVKFKGGRVVVGGGTMASGSSNVPDPSESVLVLDAWSVQALGGSCGKN